MVIKRRTGCIKHLFSFGFVDNELEKGYDSSMSKMDYKVGFIGCGNMGSAILKGMLQANLFASENIYVYAADETQHEKLKNEFKVRIAKDNKEIMELCDFVILAIKPVHFPSVIAEIKDIYQPNKVVVSIAAGMKISKIQELFEQPIKVVRIMPNTPALVNEGASGICASANVSLQENQVVTSIFAALGVCVQVPEENMHGVVAVSGSSPAYVFMFIDALIQGAVQEGLSYEDARLLASQSVLGAAKLVQESDESLETLVKNVCSPGGTTIEAVQVLEQENMKGIVEKAMAACAAKSRKMSE